MGLAAILIAGVALGVVVSVSGQIPVSFDHGKLWHLNASGCTAQSPTAPGRITRT